MIQPVGPRIDGRAKVLGEKVYGADMRPADRGWGDLKLLHALYLRAGSVGTVKRVDTSLLPSDLQPIDVVVAQRLLDANVAPISSGPARWILGVGDVAVHPGQPIALCYFDDISRMRDAAQWLREGGSVHEIVHDGRLPEFDVRRLSSPLLASVERERPEAYGRATTYVRFDDPTEGFSAFANGDHNVLAVSEAAEPDAARRDRNRIARARWQQIESLLASEGWRVIDRTFTSPTHDPMFMEPESGIAWWDAARGTLRLVAGTQSPFKDRSNLIAAFKGMVGVNLTEAKLDIAALLPGGGFGGRDDSTFAVYLALAALFSPHPVRLAFDRFEQFLVGIKRHAATIHHQLGFDSNGMFQALISTTTLDGGGEKNLTGAVVGLAALHSAGPYAIPRSVVIAEGIKTPGAPAGSMRGFGIPQVCLAMESVVDEAAQVLAIDPIELRRRNALSTGGLDVRGAPLIHDLANVRLLDAAAAEPLWQTREAERKARSIEGVVAWGVGFAMCMEAYGTTSDAALGGVEIAVDGTLTVHSSAMDMGQGAATAVAMATRPVLSRIADRVDLEDPAEFDGVLQSVKAISSKPVNAMSASMSAFHKVHAVEIAAQGLRRWTLEPAARALAGVGPDVSVSFDEEGARVGAQTFGFDALGQHAHAHGLPVEVLAHTYFQQRFSVADFELDGITIPALSADVLHAKRAGQSASFEVTRSNLVQPTSADRKTTRTLYASAGHIIGVEVNLRSGRVRVTDAVCVLDAGQVLHEPLLMGQVEGGFAMGLGMALHEEIPPYPVGVDGRVNLHRYQVARLRHMPSPDHFKVTLVDLPTASVLADGIEPRAYKGVAEACMTTVAPAVLNAVAHATGRRFHTVPLTASRFLESGPR